MRNFGVRLSSGCCVFCVTLAPLHAQRSFSGSAEIEQSLHKLNELGTVLHIAAHPGRRTHGGAGVFRARTAHAHGVSLADARRGRAEPDRLASRARSSAIIRTQELLAARQIDGAEQFFTRAIDFGFTRTAEETLQKWGHDRILSDVVWVVRRYRPDVILLGFSGTPRDGHGQHQTSAILGKEAFTAAADPKMFPEQLKYVQVWQAKRLVQAAGFGGFGARRRSGGGRGGRGGAPRHPAARPGARTGAPARRPIPARSIRSWATRTKNSRCSAAACTTARAPARCGVPGAGTPTFTIIGGAPATKDLFDGIDTTWNRLPGGGAVKAILDEAIRNYEPAHPEKVIPALVKARPLIAAIDDPLAKIKLGELDETIALCAGLFVEAQARQSDVAPGATLKITTTVLNRSTAKVGAGERARRGHLESGRGRPSPRRSDTTRARTSRSI